MQVRIPKVSRAKRRYPVIPTIKGGLSHSDQTSFFLSGQIPVFDVCYRKPNLVSLLANVTATQFLICKITAKLFDGEIFNIYLKDGACVSLLAKVLEPGLESEKYIFAALVVPKSRFEPVSCTLLKASRNIWLWASSRLRRKSMVSLTFLSSIWR